MSATTERQIKDTSFEWIGDIPEDWTLRKFRHCFQESSETNGLEIVGEMLSISGYRGVEIKQYSSDSQKRDANQLETYRVVRKGQLAMNTMWLNYAGLGVSEFEGHMSPAYRAYNFTFPADARYTHYLLRSSSYVEGYTSLLQGVRPNSLQMSRESLMNTPIVTPPIEEQKAIADFLDRELVEIDSLISKQEKLVELSRARRYSAISRLIRLGYDVRSTSKSSGLEWLGDVSAEAKLIRLRFLAKVETGFGDTQDANPDGEFNFYVRSDNVERSDSFDFIGPAVLTSGDGAGVGKVYHLANGKFKAHQRCYVMKDFSGISAEYFYWYFSTFFINEVNPGTAKSTVESLRRPMLTNFPILVHSSEREETLVKQIADIAAKSDAIVSKAEEVIEKLRERRQSLISAAVMGKIDVRKVA